MGTRYAVVKGVTSGHSVAMQTAVGNNSGTFIKHDLTTLNFDAEFPTDADGAQFETDAIAISAVYADIDWDPFQALRVQQGKV